MRKLNAFTLIELIVVLILSSLMVTLSMTVYFYLNKNFANQKSATDTLILANKIKTLIDNDFFHSNKIEDRNDNLVMTFNTDTILYKLQDRNIIRVQNTISDSFHFNELVYKLYMNSKEKQVNGLIDELKMDIVINGIPMSFHFKKEYDAVQLINTLRQNDIQ